MTTDEAEEQLALEQLDDLLTHMAVCKFPRRVRSSIDGAYALTGLEVPSDGWTLHPDIAPKWLRRIGRWRHRQTVSTCITPTNDGLWLFNSVVAIAKGTPEYRRQRAYREFLVRVERVALFPDGSAVDVTHYAGFNGDTWETNEELVTGRPTLPVDDEVRRTVENAASYSIGLALRRLVHWTVEFGYDSTPRIALHTDVSGARAAFRLREVPAGLTRRAALLHWVRAHRRRNPVSDESFVRAHLRGATEFEWNGLRCRISPSALDIAKAGGREGHELLDKDQVDWLAEVQRTGKPA